MGLTSLSARVFFPVDVFGFCSNLIVTMDCLGFFFLVGVCGVEGFAAA